MDTEQTEGTIFQYEDYILYVKWKTKDLLQRGYTIPTILKGKDDDTWHYYANLFINEI